MPYASIGTHLPCGAVPQRRADRVTDWPLSAVTILEGSANGAR
jgi:hypothetical protein